MKELTKDLIIRFETYGDVIANVFENPDGKRLLVLWNGGKETQEVVAYGNTYTLEYNDFKLIRLRCILTK